MSEILQVLPEEAIKLPSSESTHKPCVILAGQPNAGKTSLFNSLTGLRGHTANFPGTTVEVRKGSMHLDSQEVLLLDLPGLYGLEGNSLDQAAARAAICGEKEEIPKPDVMVMVLDAMRLPHQLPLAAELRERNIPVIVALNMMDEVQKKKISIDLDVLSKELGAEIVPISARKGIGIDVLVDRIRAVIDGSAAEQAMPEDLAACTSCLGCSATARCSWADNVAKQASPSSKATASRFSDNIDTVLTSPLLGLPIFAVIMCLLFASVFSVAALPMDWIDGFIGFLVSTVGENLPENLFSSFLTDGVIAGIGGVVIFLPQICILFFGINLLESSGYLSRAVVVMDSIMRRFGLPGQAFVPMLAAHACAVPAIMSTRLIKSPKDRLRAILVLPLLTCSARLPVYLMVAVLLFGDNTLAGTMVFVGGYLLGALAAVLVSVLLQHTIVPGSPTRLAVELPPYRIPSIRDALYTSLDRGLIFLRQAGSVILMISIVLWFLATFPRATETDWNTHQSTVAAQEVVLTNISTDSLQNSANFDQFALEYSMVGRIGKFVEPVFEPLGFDWRISVGVITSFAAREVVVSALAVISGVGNEVGEDDPSLIASLRAMKRPDGSTLFDIPTALSLLVFFVLAMQCLPTQAITYRETQSWRWPVFQLVYMTALAYGAAFLTYRLSSLLL